jgi:hypothetical protein
MIHRISGTAISILLATTLACSDATGPGTDGALNVSAAVLTPEGFFTLAANRRGALLQFVDGLRLAALNVSGVGHYPLTGDSGRGSYVIFDRVFFQDTMFSSTPTNIGELEITGLDTLAHRIAGRFNFQAQEINGPRWVNVDAGVFRATYTTSTP